MDESLRGVIYGFPATLRTGSLAPLIPAQSTIMATKKDAPKRKRLFVDPQVQGSLVRQLIIHWSLACLLIFLYLFALQAFSNGFALNFQENLVSMWQQFGILGLVLLVVSPVFIYDSVKLSNRFVGPMVSFRRAIRGLANGEEIAELNFRRGDFWKDITVDFNKISQELQQLRAQQADAAQPTADQQELTEVS